MSRDDVIFIHDVSSHLLGVSDDGMGEGECQASIIRSLWSLHDRMINACGPIHTTMNINTFVSVSIFCKLSLNREFTGSTEYLYGQIINQVFFYFFL